MLLCKCTESVFRNKQKRDMHSVLVVVELRWEKESVNWHLCNDLKSLCCWRRSYVSNRNVLKWKASDGKKQHKSISNFTHFLTSLDATGLRQAASVCAGSWPRTYFTFRNHKLLEIPLVMRATQNLLQSFDNLNSLRMIAGDSSFNICQKKISLIAVNLSPISLSQSQIPAINTKVSNLIWRLKVKFSTLRENWAIKQQTAAIKIVLQNLHLWFRCAFLTNHFSLNQNTEFMLISRAWSNTQKEIKNGIKEIKN